MPLYEYQCEACGHRFEVIQKYADAPISVCPACGGAVSKLFSSPAIQFKGSGFYLTDYGRGGGSDTAPGKTSAGAEKKSEGAGEAKADAPAAPAAASTTETKTEKKAEPKPTSPGAASS